MPPCVYISSRECQNLNILSHHSLKKALAISPIKGVSFTIWRLMTNSLTPYFSPRGVVIIGASTSPEKSGYSAARNLVQSGYAGAIHFVSQKQGQIFGHPLYTNLGDVPEPVDLAESMLCKTWAGKKLKGFRNIPPVDRESVIGVLIKLSLLAHEHPEIEEIEINPLRVLKKGAVAVDVRVKFGE